MNGIIKLLGDPVLSGIGSLITIGVFIWSATTTIRRRRRRALRKEAVGAETGANALASPRLTLAIEAGRHWSGLLPYALSSLAFLWTLVAEIFLFENLVWNRTFNPDSVEARLWLMLAPATLSSASFMTLIALNALDGYGWSDNSQEEFSTFTIVWAVPLLIGFLLLNLCFLYFSLRDSFGWP